MMRGSRDECCSAADQKQAPTAADGLSLCRQRAVHPNLLSSFLSNFLTNFPVYIFSNQTRKLKPVFFYFPNCCTPFEQKHITIATIMIMFLIFIFFFVYLGKARVSNESIVC